MGALANECFHQVHESRLHVVKTLTTPDPFIRVSFCEPVMQNPGEAPPRERSGPAFERTAIKFAQPI